MTNDPAAQSPEASLTQEDLNAIQKLKDAHVAI